MVFHPGLKVFMKWVIHGNNERTLIPFHLILLPAGCFPLDALSISYQLHGLLLFHLSEEGEWDWWERRSCSSRLIDCFFLLYLSLSLSWKTKKRKTVLGKKRGRVFSHLQVYRHQKEGTLSASVNFPLIILFSFFLLQPNEHASHCEILEHAFLRFSQRTFPRRKGFTAFDKDHPWFETLSKDSTYQGVIREVEIELSNPKGCEDKYPKLDMDEHCKSRSLPIIDHPFIHFLCFFFPSFFFPLFGTRFNFLFYLFLLFILCLLSSLSLVDMN